MKTGKSREIEEFIVDNLAREGRSVGRVAAEKFGVSRQTITNYLHDMVKRGILEATGKTKDRTYKLKLLVNKSFKLPVTESLDESDVWLESVRPLLSDVKDNVRAICDYGFTEMLNNVKDHSGSKEAEIIITIDAAKITMAVRDFGIGIFKKVMQFLGLTDHRHAFLELAKGKFTSDRERHSGQGIFFTSRMFDDFILTSYGYTFCRLKNPKPEDPGWLFEVSDNLQGTEVIMRISQRATQTTSEIINKYSHELDVDGFTKTHIPLTLARYEGEQLVSRSQAKRILNRAHEFKEVILDFAGVKTIGQAFADEIFRVYKRAHPQVEIVPINTNPEIDRMINHVLAGKEKLGEEVKKVGKLQIAPTDQVSVSGSMAVITGVNSNTASDPSKITYSFVDPEKKSSS